MVNVGRVLLMLLAVALVAPVAACGAAVERPSAAPAARGELVTAEQVMAMNGPQTSGYLAEWNYPVAQANGVRGYRVEYGTIGPDGAPTTASGLVVVPDTGNTQLRAVSYAHGTMVRRDEAPSVADGSDRARTAMFAAAGYLAVAPDYLGLGTGPGAHPYAHAPSEATASVDLLLAARTLLAQQEREVHPEALVTGFSQGGQAALALGKELSAGRAQGLSPGAVAAVSGPYEVQEVQAPAALDGRVEARQAVVFLAYWITAMNRIYHLYDRPADAFRPPYAQRVENLFDGHHDLLSISAGLPRTPQELLTPEFLELARNPTGPGLRAMADSDTVCDWDPGVPVRLYGTSADRSVPFENSQRCLKAELGADAELIDLGVADHGSTVNTALPQILDWFRNTAPPA
ncbi:alpha/beta hydrolase family protein [Nocardia sp. NPDC051750]|uniref:alpha/beta hydrolase family protein n=1 Tax=Nocardia sp. NPDC051750 TaxID=3364325 RepID=UPI0037B4DA1A